MIDLWTSLTNSRHGNVSNPVKKLFATSGSDSNQGVPSKFALPSAAVVRHYPTGGEFSNLDVMPVSHRRTLVRSPNARKDADLPTSHLGKALTVKGVLETEGEVHIQGSVLGRISADRLVIGAEGYVEGDVIARDVRVVGRVKGRIFAYHVTLDSSANITGRVFHHVVTVEKGAKIDGRMPWRPLNFFESFEQPPEAQT